MHITINKYVLVSILVLIFVLILTPLTTVFGEIFSSWSFDANKLEIAAQDPTAWVFFDMVSREEVVVPSAEQTKLSIDSDVASTLSNEDVFQMKMKTEPETVLPPDDRSLISFPSTLLSPWSSVCKLLITFPDDPTETWIGSGAIIGPGQDGHGYHILTAGHCVYNHDHGGWATSLLVIPGYDGAQTEVYKQKPFYHAFVTGARTYTAWTSFANHQHDWAVCTLDRNIGDFTGWMGRATYPSSDPIYTGVLNTAGYPMDIDDGLRMYYDSDNGRVADEYNHWYYMDTYGGQNGSPVWHLNATTGQRKILTVHAYGDDGSGSNHGTRLNENKYDSINTWLLDDTPPVDRPDLCDDGQGWSGFSPTTVYSGVTDFNVYCDVRNFGTAAATSFSVAYYASVDEIITTSDYLIGTFSIDSVSPLTYTDSSWNGVFPSGIPPGDYWVGWIIDNENSVTEFDESNNVAHKTSYQLHVSAGGSLEVSPSSGPGGVDVELTGSGYPPATSVTLSYYDSALDLWNVLDTVTADPSGDIAYTTEVPDLRRSGPSGDNAEMYALVSYRSEVGGTVHGYADYSQYLRGMKTVGDQTAAGLYGNGTNLAGTVTVYPSDKLTLVGKWFHPGVIYVRWDGEAVVGTVTGEEWLDAVIIGTAVANQEEGYFETTATIPTADAGEHYLSIEDSETKLIIVVNMTVGSLENSYLVVRGSDNGIYYRTYDTVSSTWSSWSGLPGLTPDTPAAAVCGSQLHVVVRGMDGASLFHGFVNLLSDEFSGWSWVSGSTPSIPKLTSNENSLYLVVRGDDNRIYLRSYDLATDSWGAWSVAPTGTTLDSPGACIDGDYIHLVVRGMDDSIYHQRVYLPIMYYHGWSNIGGTTPSIPALTSNYKESGDDHRLYLVVRGSDNGIYLRSYAGSWSSWTKLPGSTNDAFGACIVPSLPDDDACLHIVVRGMDGAMYHGKYDLNSKTFLSWSWMSGTTPSPPTLTS
jgi:glutamyl endopeptidase